MQDQYREKVPTPVLFTAKVLSYIFHPLFIPLYAVAFLIYIHPSAFTGFSMLQKKQVLFITALNVVGFPLISVLLLKALGFIQSVYMHTQKDRIIPYMACGIFFFWAYTVFRQQPHYPGLLTSFLFGIFLASSGGLIANIYFKISMHAIGMGGLIGFMLVINHTQTMLMTWPLSISFLIAGMVCSARLMAGHHSQKDIYMGIAVGLLSQVAAAIYIL